MISVFLQCHGICTCVVYNNVKSKSLVKSTSIMRL